MQLPAYPSALWHLTALCLLSAEVCCGDAGACSANDGLTHFSSAADDGQRCSSSATDPGFARLCAWLAEECDGIANGIQKVFLGTFDHGGVAVRGLGAGEAIEEGEQVFCVPDVCWIRRDLEDVRVKQLTFDTEECGEREVLAIHLAEERRKGNESFWEPYLSWLPASDAFKQFHSAYLTGIGLPEPLDFWTPWSRNLKACYNVYSERAVRRGRVPASWEQVYEALVLIITRTFAEVDFVPLADTVNTEPVVNVRQIYFNRANDKMCLRALRDISPGEELLLDYGTQADSASLVFNTYGFTLPRGYHDETEQEELCRLLDMVVLPEPAQADGSGAVENFRAFAASQCAAASV